MTLTMPPVTRFVNLEQRRDASQSESGIWSKIETPVAGTAAKSVVS